MTDLSRDGPAVDASNALARAATDGATEDEEEKAYLDPR